MKLFFTCCLLTFFNIQLSKANVMPAEPVMKMNWFQHLDSYRSTGNAIAVDKEGFIYVTGNFEEWIILTGEKIHTKGKIFRDPDFFVAKYDPQGNLIWIDHAGGAKADAGIAIAVFEDNVYVTGYFSDTATIGGEKIYTSDVQNIFIANYSTDGKIKWLKQPKGDGVLRPQGLAADKEGNIYLTGNFRHFVAFDSFSVKKQMEKNIFIVKLNKYGETQWLRSAAGGNNFYTFAYAYDIATDADDNVIIAGEMSGPVRFGDFNYITSFAYYADGRLARRELFIAKYDTKGNLLWMKEAGVEARFADLITDKDNNIILTGYFTGAVNGALAGKAIFDKNIFEANIKADGDIAETLFLISYSKKGHLNWATTAKSNFNSRGMALAAGINGNIFLTGYYSEQIDFYGNILSATYPGKAEVFIADITPEGSIQSARNFASSKGSISKGIAVDATGNVIICGNYQGSTLSTDKWIKSAGYENFFITKFENYLITKTEE